MPSGVRILTIRLRAPGGWLESECQLRYQKSLVLNLTLCISFWRRMIITTSPGAQQRFRETMDFFFQAVTQQAKDRATGIVPDLESYIMLRRDTR